MNNRGYLFTVVTVLMLMSVFTVAYYYHSRQALTTYYEITPYKNRAVDDNVKVNSQDVLGLYVQIARNRNVTITFVDHVPSPYNVTAAILDYAAHINNKSKMDINSNITYDVAGFDRLFPIEPFGYVYGWVDDFKRGIRVYNTTVETDNINGYDITANFTGENIQDTIYQEAENMSGMSWIGASAQASGGFYAKLLPTGRMWKNITVPFTVNYTLWVRSRDNETTSNQFKVELAGRNSSVNFGEHTDGAWSFGWQKGDEFNLSEGYAMLRVIGLYGNNASIDAILLATDKDLDPDDWPPYGEPHDPLYVSATPGSLGFNLTAQFANHNYTYSGGLNNSYPNTFNFTFIDEDSLSIRAGLLNMDGLRGKSVEIAINSTANGTSGVVTTRMRIEV